MDPQELVFYRDAVQKYGALKFTKLAPRQLRENFVSRLEAFIPPCLMVTEIWGPVIALQNLAGTLSHVPSDVSRVAPRTGPLQDAWSEVFDAMIANHRLDDVRRWLQFLQTLCASSSSANRGITSPAKTIVLSSITHFLFACLKLQGYSLCYWFNEAGGALGFIGNIWYLQAERSAPLPGTPPAKILHFALLCWARDMYDTKGEDPAKARYTQRLMAETKKDLHELTYAALSYLLRDTEEKAREAIVSHLVMLLLISRLDAAQQLLLAQDALHIVTRALVCVVRPRRASRDEASDEAVISGCTYLQKCINMGDGPSCIVRAFEAGFLTALLSGFHDPAHSQTYAILATLLPSYLLHLSVVRAAAKALKKIRKLGIEKHMDRRGPIMEAWSIFKEVLEERIEVAGKTVHLKCANKQILRMTVYDTVSMATGTGQLQIWTPGCRKMIREGDMTHLGVGTPETHPTDHTSNPPPALKNLKSSFVP
ncbi:hypothetical protein B0H11DRAFT_2219415 [Mycena galericulata]|nr:hypothetical protein B0H11DRAFT_2219415 [Mycena galericulata]